MAVLREGFTTGSCAAAAALACCLWQRDGVCPSQVSIIVPEGRTYAPSIIPHADGSCGVIKDSGDDPDITNGIEIIAKVILRDENGAIVFRAGDGVGIVTESGLKIPTGEPAINPVPRKMIEDAVRSVYGDRSAEVTVSAPGGRELAQRTFNPRLGIVGGISILGTSGIVRPMSDEALRESLYAELKMRASQGHEDIVFTFGNQGEEAMRRLFPDACIIQISNEVGFMLDSAQELGVRHILLGGHPGKLSKVAAGVMQTHSKYGDARLEAIITHLARMEAPIGLIESVYACKTTDAAMKLICEAEYDGVWHLMAKAAQRYCGMRVRNEVKIDVVYLDSRGDIIGSTME
ncbi:MAG: cobalt-precorrin-5B (C(1))-methyltransferase CbiD [Christensenellales bacterium]|jgi:cobalt-precorrin-5B (C1)-methyltransferase